MSKTLVAILITVILAVSFLAAAKIFSDTAISIKNKGYVKVKGFAKQEIKSDLGIFKAKLATEGADLKLCYKNLKEDKDKTNDFLKNFGVKEAEIEMFPVQVVEEYKINERGHETDEFVKYILKQKFKIELSDVKKIAALSEKISELLDKGVKISAYEPKYVYTNLDDLKVEMIGKATANAKERAKIIAKQGSFRLGPIASVRVGVFQITPAHSTRVSGYGINDTSSIDKEIKSVVEIEYFVK
ncbi:MAG: SIMPL domain-containing protein [Candidatus Omnitrophica bacterium]|nr:SIMPL domain-containing protein [Candidatus Omnitrophota bacterium]MCF7909799.1 SIMPL domain-containing protein [Candidatus Omnitrophota bacterium]